MAVNKCSTQSRRAHSLFRSMTRGVSTIPFASMRHWMRAGFAYVSGQRALDIPEAEVVDALVSYGWEGGLIGDLVSPARIEALAEQAVVATPNVDPAVRYPAALLTRMANWLAILTANDVVAEGRTLETITAQKRCGAGGAAGRHRAGAFLLLLGD